MVMDTVSQFGVPDIVLNNAGIFFSVNFDTMTEEEWHRMMDVNLTSVFLVSQQVIRQWLANDHPGVIVNTSSMVASMTFTNSSHYIAAKTGMVGLTRAMALDYAEHKVRVNAIAPGIIETDMSKPSLSNPETREKWIRKVPLGRFGQPKDIAEVALFLASDASSYITGQTITVDGGWLLE